MSFSISPSLDVISTTCLRAARHLLIGLGSLAFLLPATGWGTNILINSDFSSGVAGGNSITDTEVNQGWVSTTRWTTGVSPRDINTSASTTVSYSYPAGVLGRNTGGATAAGWFGQIIDGTGHTGDQWELAFDYELWNGNVFNPNEIWYEVWGANGATAPGFALDSDTVTGWTQILDGDYNSPTSAYAADSGMITAGVDLGAGYDYLAVRIRSNNIGNYEYGWFDNATLSVVPEPSVALLVLFALGMVLVRRGRRSRASV